MKRSFVFLAALAMIGSVSAQLVSYTDTARISNLVVLGMNPQTQMFYVVTADHNSFGSSNKIELLKLSEGNLISRQTIHSFWSETHVGFSHPVVSDLGVSFALNCVDEWTLTLSSVVFFLPWTGGVFSTEVTYEMFPTGGYIFVAAHEGNTWQGIMRRPDVDSLSVYRLVTISNDGSFETLSVMDILDQDGWCVIDIERSNTRYLVYRLRDTTNFPVYFDTETALYNDEGFMEWSSMLGEYMEPAGKQTMMFHPYGFGMDPENYMKVFRMDSSGSYVCIERHFGGDTVRYSWRGGSSANEHEYALLSVIKSNSLARVLVSIFDLCGGLQREASLAVPSISLEGFRAVGITGSSGRWMGVIHNELHHEHVYYFFNEPFSGMEALQSGILEVFPNPVSLPFNVFVPPALGLSTIVISNMEGKRVFMCQCQGQCAIDISHLSSGIYEVSILGSGRSQKIIKN